MNLSQAIRDAQRASETLDPSTRALMDDMARAQAILDRVPDQSVSPIVARTPHPDRPIHNPDDNCPACGEPLMFVTTAKNAVTTSGPLIPDAGTYEIVKCPNDHAYAKRGDYVTAFASIRGRDPRPTDARS